LTKYKEKQNEYRNDSFDCLGADSDRRDTELGSQQKLGVWPQRRYRIGAVDSSDSGCDGQDIAADSIRR
jgi:hypothetical protein